MTTFPRGVRLTRRYIRAVELLEMARARLDDLDCGPAGSKALQLPVDPVWRAIDRFLKSEGR